MTDPPGRSRMARYRPAERACTSSESGAALPAAAGFRAIERMSVQRARKRPPAQELGCLLGALIDYLLERGAQLPLDVARRRAARRAVDRHLHDAQIVSHVEAAQDGQAVEHYGNTRSEHCQTLGTLLQRDAIVNHHPPPLPFGKLFGDGSTALDATMRRVCERGMSRRPRCVSGDTARTRLPPPTVQGSLSQGFPLARLLVGNGFP